MVGIRPYIFFGLDLSWLKERNVIQGLFRSGDQWATTQKPWVLGSDIMIGPVSALGPQADRGESTPSAGWTFAQLQNLTQHRLSQQKCIVKAMWHIR